MRDLVGAAGLDADAPVGAGRRIAAGLHAHRAPARAGLAQLDAVGLGLPAGFEGDVVEGHARREPGVAQGRDVDVARAPRRVDRHGIVGAPQQRHLRPDLHRDRDVGRAEVLLVEGLLVADLEHHGGRAGVAVLRRQAQAVLALGLDGEVLARRGADGLAGGDADDP